VLREEPLLIHEGCEEGKLQGTARVAVNTTRLGAAFAWPMGSTQGASLSIAHDGAFYGATVDSTRALQAIQGS